MEKIMKENVMKFMGHLLDVDSPFNDYAVKKLPNIIDVVITTNATIEPSALGWLNTHLVGGRWWISADADCVQITIRFYEDR